MARSSGIKIYDKEPLVNNVSVRNPDASTASGIFNIINTIIGGGALALPYVMKESGVAWGLTMVFLVGILSIYSQRLLVHASDFVFHKPTGYAELGAKMWPRYGHIYAELCVILFLLGAQVGYLVIIGAILTPMLNEIGVPFTYEMTSGIGAVLILPLSSLRHIKSLSYTSFVALFFIFCLAVGVITKSSKRMAQYGVDHDQFSWTGNGFAGIFVSLPIINFAFTFHPSVPPVWKELRDQSKESINFISAASVLFCGVFYVVLGIFGYMYNYTATGSNILLEFRDDILFIAIKLGYTLVIAFSYPVLNYATRNGIDTLLFPHTQPAPIWRLIVESTIIVGTTYGFAVLIPSIDTVFGIIGATIGQIVIFINPALYYIILYDPYEEISIEDDSEVYTRDSRQDKNWKRYFIPSKLPAMLLILVGILCGIVSVVEIALKIHRGTA